MAATLGKDAVVAIGTPGSETDITSYVDNADIEFMVDTIESTVFGDEDHKFIPGLADASASLGVNWDVTIDGILWPLRGVAGKQLVIYPAGNATGLPKYAIPGFLSNYPISIPVADKITSGPTFRPSGTVVRTVVA